MSKKMINEERREKTKEEKIIGICCFLFCILFFAFWGRFIYQEYIDYETEYEYTTGTVDEVAETTKRTFFKTKVMHTMKSTTYVVTIKLEDGEVIKISTKDADRYHIGDIVDIRKIFKISDGEREFVNYNILNE